MERFLRVLRELVRPFAYPVFYLFEQLRSANRSVKWFLRVFLGFLVVLPLWAGIASVTVVSVNSMAYRMGERIGLAPSPVLIAGTGSMYPTFPKGDALTPEEREQQDVAAPRMYRYPRGFSLSGTDFFRYQLQYGDIVSFSNEKTIEILKKDGVEDAETTGFVKRIIGLAGDRLLVRDGFVYRNGSILLEPYTASARSTFGGQSITDCSEVVVPDGMIAVMGDNRKGSNDSRHELGFVSLSDIERFLPLEEQTPYMSLWRDPSGDELQAHSVVLDANAYLEQLNEIRQEHGIAPLRYDARLERSAKLRAEAMFKYNDISFDATKSGYTMDRAMREVGYQNILWGEAPTIGYYTAEELLENYAESPSWETFLLDERYDDTGIAAVVGELNGCPIQIVVQHVGGYIPPNYDQETIESWRTLRSNLQEILPSWENTRSFGKQYEDHRDDYERLIQILHERIAIANVVLAKMESNQWLTDEEQLLIQKDAQLGQDQTRLSTYLNAL